LGLPQKSRVALELTDGKKQTTAEFDVLSRLPRPAGWLHGPSRKLEGNIGYLRLAEMDGSPAFQARLRDQMTAFKGVRGLIIDVRQNGGGSREPLRTLFPYFMKANEKPYVANVARYRMPAGTRKSAEGYLDNRFLYPISSREWSRGEKKLLEKFARSFKPEWEPKGAFSDWHFMLLRPGGTRFAKPVVILMDGGCFSATDIFLGAFKGRRNVTLMGTPSAGGSGRTQTTRLSNSRMKVRLSSMASFQPNGKLYDGNGIEPDVVVEPVPTDYIGKTDSVLDAAVKRLR
jgi:C-terminal processing protease CtpA/Prc